MFAAHVMSSGADSGDESSHVVAELATSGDNASTSIAAASATIAASVTSDAEGELPSDSSLAAEERKHHDTKSKRRQANPVARRPKPVPDPTHTQAILAALDRDPPDVASLRLLARHGFVSNAIRRRVWPLLMGIQPIAGTSTASDDASTGSRVDTSAPSDLDTAAQLKMLDDLADSTDVVDTDSFDEGPKLSDSDADDDQHPAGTAQRRRKKSSSDGKRRGSNADTVLPKRKVQAKNQYSSQIRKDINRSLCHYDITLRLTGDQRHQLRKSLSRMVNNIFTRHGDLHYVQGFHDICTVFLLVCGESLGQAVVEKLAFLHIRDSLRPSLDTVVSVLSLISPLIGMVDKPVHNFLIKAQVQELFTLSWVLTWFSHNLQSFDDITRIFDHLLASHPVMPIYLTVALIVQLREGLLALQPDLAEVHAYFQQLPDTLDVEALIASSSDMYIKYPPHEIYRRVTQKMRLPLDSPLNDIREQSAAAAATARWSIIVGIVVPVTLAIAAAWLVRSSGGHKG